MSATVSPLDPEIMTSATVNVAQADEQKDSVMSFINHFSSWVCLKRMMGWLLRIRSLLVDLSQSRKQLRLSLSQSDLVKEQLEKKLQKEMKAVKGQV